MFGLMYLETKPKTKVCQKKMKKLKLRYKEMLENSTKISKTLVKSWKTLAES